jgi:hypothetical protein
MNRGKSPHMIYKREASASKDSSFFLPWAYTFINPSVNAQYDKQAYNKNQLLNQHSIVSNKPTNYLPEDLSEIAIMKYQVSSPFRSFTHPYQHV